MAKNAKLNKFNLTHFRAGSMKMGYLYPVDFVECLPGDVFKIRNEFLVRFLPTLAPSLNRYRITLRWWFSPSRLLMKDFMDFITGGSEGTDATVLPTVVAPSGGFAVGSLADYFRIPTGVAGLQVSAFPFRMYNLVYNEWYRVESIQDKVANSLESGPDTISNVDLLRANWRRDYFTDSLPSPQKGPAIGLFGGSAKVPVVGTGKNIGVEFKNNSNPWDSRQGGLFVGDSGAWGKMSVSETFLNKGQNETLSPSGPTPQANSGVGLSQNPDNSQVYADLSLLDGATINSLRQAAAVQQFQELNMRGGNRYVEFVYNMFGVRTPDASLQRPQYVGGMSSNVVISEVLQTSETTEGSAQGTMTGHGIGAGTSPLLRFRALEHGYLMCLMSIVPDTIYYQGVPRELQRETRYDFAIPLLSHLGEQAVYNQELYAQGTDADKAVFGYNPRYEEYRRIPNSICGDLRMSLNFWTSARSFNNLPQLNSEFVESHPSDDIFAVQDGTDQIVFQVMHHMEALRPLPKYGQPGLHII